MEQIWIDGLDEEDLKVLHKAVAVNYFGYDVSHIINEVAHLRMQLWKLKEEGCHVLMITQINTHPGGKEFQIWSVGGTGYTRKIDQMYKVLKEFATKEGCKWITGFVDRNAFGRLYERFNVKKYGMWMKEIDNV